MMRRCARRCGLSRYARAVRTLYFQRSSDGLPGVSRAPRMPNTAGATYPYVILAVPTSDGRGLFLYGLCDDDPCLQRTCEQE